MLKKERQKPSYPDRGIDSLSNGTSKNEELHRRDTRSQGAVSSSEEDVGYRVGYDKETATKSESYRREQPTALHYSNQQWKEPLEEVLYFVQILLIENP